MSGRKAVLERLRAARGMLSDVAQKLRVSMNLPVTLW